MRFASGRWVSVDFLPASRDEPYQVFDANLSYTTADEALTLSVFVRNLTDQVVKNYGIPHSQVQDLYGVSVNPPRTYGARLTYNF